nr:hypothetical protein MtrunA17_Chr8g0378081 [Ipomoea trifida]
MSGSAPQVHEPTLGEDNDAGFCLGEHEPVGLGLDGDPLHARVCLEPVHVDFVVEVADVAHDGVVLHLAHVAYHDDVLVAGGGDEDVGVAHHVVQGEDLQAFHEGLESADWVDLCAIVIDIDGREEEGAIILHLVKPLDTRGSLLRNPNKPLLHLGILLGITLKPIPNDSQHNLKLRIISRTRIRKSPILSKRLLSLHPLMNQQRSVTTIIHNEIRPPTGAPVQRPLRAPPVLLEGLPLPREHGGAVTRNRRGRVVLRGEDVARAPSHLRAQRREGLDQNRRLDRHMQTPSNPGALEGLRRTKFRPTSHQPWHFNLGEIDFQAAKIGLRHVLHLVLAAGAGFLDGQSHGVREYRKWD